MTPSEDDLTIDQLAQEAGVPVSTVRMYQNKKLLAPPERRGRVGYYGEQHRARMRVIASLQERGFSLAAIREVFDSWEAGRSMSDLIDLATLAPGLARQPLRLSLADFMVRFEGVELHQRDMIRAAELGLIEIDGTDVIVKTAPFVELGPAIARLGVPVDEVLDQYEQLATDLDEIAGRFRAIFETHLWEPFVADGMPEDRAVELAGDVGRLAELATSVVVTELADRFASFAEGYVQRAQS